MACPAWLLLEAYHAHYHHACWAFAAALLLLPCRSPQLVGHVTPQPA